MALGSEVQVLSEGEWSELKENLHLPPRQAEVVRQLLAGRSDKQIANRLHMAVPTVRAHIGRLFSRFSVEDRCELILYVLAHFRANCR
jgi:DNA-binding NarL/FixJ family response regulator